MISLYISRKLYTNKKNREKSFKVFQTYQNRSEKNTSPLKSIILKILQIHSRKYKTHRTKEYQNTKVKKENPFKSENSRLEQQIYPIEPIHSSR